MSSSSSLSSTPSTLCVPQHAFLCFYTLENALLSPTTSSSSSTANTTASFDDDDDDDDENEENDVDYGDRNGDREKMKKIDWEKELPKGAARLDEDYPLFVTWNKYTTLPLTTDSKFKPKSTKTNTSYDQTQDSDVEAHLRGCIGTFLPLPLGQGLKEYALTSALHDSRFKPITAKELPYIQCGVSLLTPFESVPSPLSWTLGVHGIHITFHAPPSGSSSPSRRYTATYLPEVAPSQGWSKKETVLSLIRKSGYKGYVREGDEIWRDLKVKTYRSEKVVVDWEEYVRWKESRKAKAQRMVKASTSVNTNTVPNPSMLINGGMGEEIKKKGARATIGLEEDEEDETEARLVAQTA